jgi:hypothetical protein
MLCNLYTRGPLALLPSPCGKTAHGFRQRKYPIVLLGLTLSN